MDSPDCLLLLLPIVYSSLGLSLLSLQGCNGVALADLLLSLRLLIVLPWSR